MGEHTPAVVVVTLPDEEDDEGHGDDLDDFQVTLRDDSGAPHSFVLGNGTKVEVENRLARHLELLKQYTNADMHNVTAYLATLK